MPACWFLPTLTAHLKGERLMKLLRLLALVAITGLTAGTAVAQENGKIKVLIIDGINNHDWKHTSPFLKQQLEKTGKFTVDISTTPPANAPKKDWSEWNPDLTKYQVVLSNYNGPQWPEHVRKNFEEFISEGGGLVNVHAANNAHSGWKEFEKMTGLLWRGAGAGWRLAYDKDQKPVRVPPKEGPGASHGPQHQYEVVVIDSDNPITKGMPKRWLHPQDELYHGQRGPAEDMHVLAIAFSATNKGGTGMYEPMLWYIPYGKGKAVTTVLGHVNNGDGKNMIAMRDVGFLTIVARACEWAATGRVTLPVPADFPTADKTSVVPPPGAAQ
jgi:type 1 glutamine amidotransferase